MRSLIGCLLLPCLAAQAPERVSAAGRVVATDGTPLPNAHVVLLHRAIPPLIEAIPEDRVEVTTDAKGMFRADLASGRNYSAWATWPSGATEILEGVRARDFAVLEASPTARARTVAVEGLEAWAERGPLSFRVHVGTEHIDFVSVPLIEGALSIPPLPSLAYRMIEAIDRHGVLLWAGRLPTADDEPFPIPEPVAFEVLARDPDTDAPLAGVEIRQHLLNYWYTESPTVAFGDRFRCLWPVVGTTDAEGRLKVDVAVAPATTIATFFMAQKSGYRGAMVGVNSAGEVNFELSQADVAAGEVRLFDGPIESGWFAPIWRVHDEATGLGLPFVPPPVPIDGGRFAGRPMPAGAELERAWTVLPDATRAAVLERFGCEIPNSFELPQPKRALDVDGPVQLDLDRLRAIEVLEPHGQVAQRAVVLVSPVRKGRPVPDHGQLVRTNRVGRALIAVSGGPQHVVIASDLGWTAFDADSDLADVHQVQLQAMAEVAGRIEDQDGKPVPYGQVLVTPREVGDSPIDRSEASRLWGLLSTARADADGRFRLGLPHLPIEWRLRALDPVAGPVAGLNSLKEQVLHGDDIADATDVVLVLTLDR